MSLSSLRVRTAALTSVGVDDHADTLCRMLQSSDVDVRYILRDDTVPTALAILPLFKDGRRGCFVTLGTNLTMHPIAVLEHSPLLNDSLLQQNLRVFHFGYPHIMPHFQGRGLYDLFAGVRQRLPNVMITLDLNGAGDDSAVLIPESLAFVAHVHANVEEACGITALFPLATAAENKLSTSDVKSIANWFISRRVASVSITCGCDGAFLATTSQPDVLDATRLTAEGFDLDAFVYRQAFCTQVDNVNASGAGDAFVAGIIAQLVHSSGACGAQHLLESGLASALRRIDPTLVSEPTEIDDVVAKALSRKRIPPRATFEEPKPGDGSEK